MISQNGRVHDGSCTIWSWVRDWNHKKKKQAAAAAKGLPALSARWLQLAPATPHYQFLIISAVFTPPPHPTPYPIRSQQQWLRPVSETGNNLRISRGKLGQTENHFLGKYLQGVLPFLFAPVRKQKKKRKHTPSIEVNNGVYEEKKKNCGDINKINKPTLFIEPSCWISH